MSLMNPNQSSPRQEVHVGDHVAFMGMDAEVKSVEGNLVTLRILGRGVEVEILKQDDGRFAIKMF
jgi:hypothetical protein